MSNVLVMTSNLPFFPGKNGHDFFNTRHLSQYHRVGVVGPEYPQYPAESVKNLEQHIDGAYFWPRPAPASALHTQRQYDKKLAWWLYCFPAFARRALLRRLLQLHRDPPNTIVTLGILANCAPQLLRALHDKPWHAMALIQTDLVPWLNFLPTTGAKLIYFHDVRSDYLRRQSNGTMSRLEHSTMVSGAARQESTACREADLVAFVSELDRQRAQNLFNIKAESGVAPIPIDTDYYTPAPASWKRPGHPVVLFTGHLGHPPNVDAVTYFLAGIWPAIRQAVPDARFHVVGCAPADSLSELCARTAGVELHANVPDIRPYFWNASAYVVPMRFGGGVRQKIFEAWSMRVPVVCTTMAAEGTIAENGINCQLEDADASFAGRVVSLLRTTADPALLDRASQTVREHHSIPQAAGQFEAQVRRTIQTRRHRPYRLLLDLRWMEIGKAGGMEQMCYELVSAISKLDHRNEYSILCPRSTYCEWQFPPQFKCKGHFVGKAERKAEALHASLVNQLAESTRKPQVMTPEMRTLKWYRQLDFDLVHSPCSYMFPDLACFPTILTMLDLQHVHFPEFFSETEWKEREALYRGACATARHIVCISEFTRQDLHASYGIPLEKMTTTWIIPSQSAWTPLRPEDRDTLLAHMGIKEPFLFFPAHCWPHKNHYRLIEAFARIQDELPPNLKLIMTGKPFDANHPAQEAIRSHGLGKLIQHIGYRSPFEMKALFSGAHALVFPSLFEGFGMPVAEAIIIGCPVACSNTTSLPEIAGPAAVTFDPMNIDEMAGAMLTVATDSGVREKLAAACRERKHLFSPRAAAFNILGIYRRVFEDFYNG